MNDVHKCVILVFYDGAKIIEQGCITREEGIQSALDEIFDRIRIKRKYWTQRKIKSELGHLIRVWETRRDKKLQVVVGIKNEKV